MSDSHLYRALGTGRGSQSPDDVESGERAGGEEGAGQDDHVPLNHLQAGFHHGHPQRSLCGLNEAGEDERE